MDFNIDDDELLKLLDVEGEPEVASSKISKVAFNEYVFDKIENCDPDEVLSILVEVKAHYEIDEDAFGSLLSDKVKDFMEYKLRQVLLVGNTLKNKKTNLGIPL